MHQLTLFDQQPVQNQFKLFPQNRSSPQFDKPEQQEQPLTLRPYQKRAIADLYASIKRQSRSPLMYAPTGSGKTVMAAHIARDAISRSRRVLFLVHRDALIQQTVSSLIGYGIPEETIGYIKAGYPHASDDQQVIVASIQSLARRDYPAKIGLIIVDEAHTTAFYTSYKTIRETYLHDGQKGTIIIGLTASPWRNKTGEGMKHAGFDSLTVAATITGLIRNGHLAKPRYFGFGGMIDLSQFETKDGDYKASQVQSACMAEGFNERIVEEFRKLCPDRTAIAFCSSIEQSRYLAELFNDGGIVAEHLEGDTPTSIREGMYERLSNGKTRVLCSVGTLTEGFDVKSISAIILARPTKSVSLYVQICGRGLRSFPGKKDCYLLDFADVIKGDGKRRGLGFLSEQPEPTLEPLKEKPDHSKKECPSCGNLVNKLVKICPRCGYEFDDVPSQEQQKEEEVYDDIFEEEFGELFDQETQEKVDYLRKQTRTRFTQELPRDRLWELFYNRYGHYPDNNWFFGALFGRNRTEFNQQQFIDYLYKTSSRQPPRLDWIRFHLRLEFGDYAIKSFVPTEGMKWYEILQCNPDADMATIKRNYRKLSLQHHPDHGGTDDQMKLLNWAFDKAKDEA